MDYISIIIPAYNSERWLARCLDSVLEAADAECEIIVVDDGSEDRTPQIARRYSDSDPRISVISVDHCGPCAARKAGFLESQGDYIVFVDSDDTMTPDAIERMRHLSEEQPRDNVLDKTLPGITDYQRQADGRPLMIIANTVHHAEDGAKSLLISGHRRALTGAEYALEVLTHVIPGILPGHMFARELLEAIDWDDSPEITNHEHSLLMLSMSMKLQEWDEAAGQVTRRILLEPAEICYNFIGRPGSQACMMSLTPAGLGRVWSHLVNLRLPELELTMWGLDLIIESFIDRGIPFPSDFSMAVDLRRRAAIYRNDLPDKYTPYIDSLTSASKRRRISRRESLNGSPTMLEPHATFIIACNDNPRDVRRSALSILNTGFRNIEIILVDCNSKYESSVELTAMSITFPRVRVVKAQPGISPVRAYYGGLKAARGSAVSFVRAGDKVGAEGMYRAVATVDYGADLVLVNTRRISRFTQLRGRKHSHAHLLEGKKNNNDVYAQFVDSLKNLPENSKTNLMVYGNMWNRETITRLAGRLQMAEFDRRDPYGLSRRLFLALLDEPIRVVPALQGSPVSYYISVRTLVKHTVEGRLSLFLF